MFVVAIWFINQLLIAVLGGVLLYLVFRAYQLQRAAAGAPPRDPSHQPRRAEEGGVAAARSKPESVELHAPEPKERRTQHAPGTQL